MEADLEDGEISGSDTEMGAARPPVPPASSGRAAAYRSSGRPVASSDSDAASSDEEATLWRRKRHKASPRPACAAPPEPSRPPAGRKVNNIWGSVVQEQSQDAVAAELGFFGMEGEVSMSSRNVETYNFVLARKIMEKERELERRASDGEVSMDGPLEDGPKDGDAKRKRPAKERLGPRAEAPEGRAEVTEDAPEAAVTEEIAHRLREPKRDLIQRIVAVIGKRKAMELLGETAALEAAGGVRTADGSRRRTPGGVFINLLKSAAGVSRAQLRRVFCEEHQRECRSKKAAQKRRRHAAAQKMKRAVGTPDGVSRETDALESPEEAADDEEEGGEEAASVVDSSAADLEVF